jgi:hypothetical protein
VKTGLSFSVFVCAAAVEFAFGVVEKGMTRSEPSLGDVVMLGFLYSLLTEVKTYH